MILVKIHQAYREVIAVCDSNLIGKNFKQDNRQLEVKETFFKGKQMLENQAVKLIKEKLAEDSCFNFVGKQAVEAGIKAGAIDKNCVMKIQGIPYALMLI